VNQLRYALIVDDHPVVGRGIAHFLKAHSLLDEVFAVRNAPECLEIVERLGPPAIAIIDFWLADGASSELITQLLFNYSETAILVISGDTNPEIQASVRRLGVRGFIDKQASPEQFSQTILALLSGMVWFEEVPLPDAGYGYFRDMPVTPAELGISSRQGQILDFILQGLPNKRIAQLLNLSESTVKEHVTGILHKLEVSNRIEAITKLRGRKLVVE
jgi:DNA-binding NarL/FixJ family response regulator